MILTQAKGYRNLWLTGSGALAMTTTDDTDTIAAKVHVAVIEHLARTLTEAQAEEVLNVLRLNCRWLLLGEKAIHDRA